MSNYLSQFNYQLYDGQFSRHWVFLHGLMGYGNNWRKIASELSFNASVLTYDQRGHGKSFRPGAGYSPADYAEDLHKILDELQWDTIVLVGHSMGGRNALAFASLYPQRVSHLIIEDIGPEERPESLGFYQNLFSKIPTPFPSRAEAKEFFTKKFPSLWTKKNSSDVGAFLFSNLYENQQGKMNWRFSLDAMLETVALGRSKDQWQDVKKLSMPTLFIRGKNSEELTQQEYFKILRSNPIVSGVEIDNAGHWVHFDQPEAFLKVIREFAGA